MDFEHKMKKWMDLAKQFQDGQFWDQIFDNDYTDKIMGQIAKTSSVNKTPDGRFPPVDIYKTTHELIIVLDLPGVLKEDLDISITDSGLYVKGFANRSYSELTRVQSERCNGVFERTIPLPEMIIARSKISAKFDNGTVEIRIPRSNRVREKINFD